MSIMTEERAVASVSPVAVDGKKDEFGPDDWGLDISFVESGEGVDKLIYMTMQSQHLTATVTATRAEQDSHRHPAVTQRDRLYPNTRASQRRNTTRSCRQTGRYSPPPSAKRSQVTRSSTNFLKESAIRRGIRSSSIYTTAGSP